MIVLKVLGAWTLVSVVTCFAIAPALSNRLRDFNFPDDNEEEE